MIGDCNTCSAAHRKGFRKRQLLHISSQNAANRDLPTTSQTCLEGPFGEVLPQTGNLEADANPFRFSTKYQDDETDLLYYGYRYYSASTGRWNSRDPAGEKRSSGLYAYLKNKSTTSVDLLGLMDAGECRKIRDKALQDDTTLQILQIELKIYKCNRPNAGCACTCKGSAAGYTYTPTGQITLCAGNIEKEQELVETLRHEYVHALDACKMKYRHQTGKEAACMEIRAATISGECNKGGSSRGDEQTFVQCVRASAVRSLGGGPQAEQYVSEAWEACFTADPNP
jgi:RHS repeat-associated protein